MTQQPTLLRIAIEKFMASAMKHGMDKAERLTFEWLYKNGMPTVSAAKFAHVVRSRTMNELYKDQPN